MIDSTTTAFERFFMYDKMIRAIIGIALVIFFFIIGCAVFSEIKRDLASQDHMLKKKIAVLPFKNLTEYKDNELGALAKSIFRDTLRKNCSTVIVENDQRSRHLEEMPKLDSEDRARIQQNRVARALGLNAVLTGTLLDITITQEEKGVWMFKKTFPAALLEFEVHFYDIETDAALLNKLVKVTINISDQDRPNPKDNRGYDPDLAKKLLQEAAFQLSEELDVIMEKEPWKGYVITFEDSKVEISAGTDVGLRPGDVLNVFGCEQPIEGTAGNYYLMSGPKIGEVKIGKVFQHTAVAEVISGADFDKSNCVKLK